MYTIQPPSEHKMYLLVQDELSSDYCPWKESTRWVFMCEVCGIASVYHRIQSPLLVWHSHARCMERNYLRDRISIDYIHYIYHGNTSRHYIIIMIFGDISYMILVSCLCKALWCSKKTRGHPPQFWENVEGDKRPEMTCVWNMRYGSAKTHELASV